MRRRVCSRDTHFGPCANGGLSGVKLVDWHFSGKVLGSRISSFQGISVCGFQELLLGRYY